MARKTYEHTRKNTELMCKISINEQTDAAHPYSDTDTQMLMMMMMMMMMPMTIIITNLQSPLSRKDTPY